eukprot:2311382-Prorocentrum_lima.AAC.1
MAMVAGAALMNNIAMSETKSTPACMVAVVGGGKGRNAEETEESSLVLPESISVHASSTPSSTLLH